MREMKDSGLQWAGNIPYDWNTTKGKYFMAILERPIKDDDGVITCFRNGEVTLRANRREDGFTIATVEAGYQGIEPGDLVIHGMDGFAGAIGISDSRGKGTPALNVLACSENKNLIRTNIRYFWLRISIRPGLTSRNSALCMFCLLYTSDAADD